MPVLSVPKPYIRCPNRTNVAPAVRQSVPTSSALPNRAGASDPGGRSVQLIVLRVTKPIRRRLMPKRGKGSLPPTKVALLSRPRSSGDRASPSGGEGAGSIPAEGTNQLGFTTAEDRRASEFAPSAWPPDTLIAAPHVAARGLNVTGPLSNRSSLRSTVSDTTGSWLPRQRAKSRSTLRRSAVYQGTESSP